MGSVIDVRCHRLLGSGRYRGPHVAWSICSKIGTHSDVMKVAGYSAGAVRCVIVY